MKHPFSLVAALTGLLMLATASHGAEESAPYKLPRLTFGLNELIPVFQQNQVESWWFDDVNKYLHMPASYWKDCVESWAERSMTFGGMSAREGLEHGHMVCASEVQDYHRCLHETPLSYAASCLQFVFMERENAAE